MASKRNYRKKYVAGLIAGEGCVRTCKWKKNGQTYIRPIVEVNMTNEEVIDYLFQNIGRVKNILKNGIGEKTIKKYIAGPYVKMKR